MATATRHQSERFPWLLLSGIGLSLALWVALALIDSLKSPDLSLIECLLAASTAALWPKIGVAAVCLLFAGLAQIAVGRRFRSTDDLYEPNLLYHTLLKTTPEAVILTDTKGCITLISPRAGQMFGFDDGDNVVGKSILELIDPGDHARATDNFRRRMKGQPLSLIEYKMIRSDGSWFHADFSATVLRDRQHTARAVIVTIRDITDRKEADRQLQYRLEFERVITSLSSRFIALAPDEIDSNIIYALQTIGEFIGIDRAYVFRFSGDGKTMSNTHEWCADGIEPQIGRLQNLSVSEFGYFTARVIRGEVFQLPRVSDLPKEAAVEKAEFESEGIRSLVCVPTISQAQTTGFLGVDAVLSEKDWTPDEITLLKIVGEMLSTAHEREHAQRAVRESEEKYRSFVQNFQGVAYRSRMNWTPLFFHGAVENITGYTEKDFITGNPRWDQIIHPDDWDQLKDSAHKIATVPGYSIEREYRIIHKNGQERWIHEFSQNICHRDGKPQLVQGALYDITERKRMEKIQAAFFKISEATNLSNNLEELLTTIHQILGTLIDTTNFYVALYDAELDVYNFPYLVDEYDDGTDLKPEQLRKSLTDYVRKTGKPLLCDEETHRKLEEQGEIILVGEPSPIWLGVPLKTPHGVIGVVTVQSYSDPALYQESDMDLMTFVSGHIAMAIERKQGEMLLRSSEQEYRTLVETMRDGVMKVDVDENIIYANPAAADILGCPSGDLEGKNLCDIIIEEEMDRVVAETRVRLENQRSRYELTARRTDGEKRRLSISAAPYFDERGKVAGAVGVFTDVTELVKAQEEGQRLREKLANAQRMESLGVLAGGVAHDLNNILGPLVGYPELIKRRLPENSPVRDQIAKIEESAKRAAEVVQDLLTMGRRGRYEMDHTSINNIISSYLDSPDYTRQKSRFPNVETVAYLDSSIPSVYGSDTHLSKVIMNLVINALDAMPDGGSLSIKTECRYLDRLLGGYTNIEPGRYCIITVSDTGIGIDEADTKRIFDPFFSKKKLGKSGSGLGLAVVYAVVKDHNGYVDVISELTKGSDFIIYLPAIESDKTVGTVKPVYDIKGDESILVVDDVAEQRDLAVTLLSSLGYQMSSVTNGREAVEYLKTNTCDVVVLDMIMEPDFDGLDTYRKIIEMYPGQKAVIVSGFSLTDRVREAEKLGVTKYVKKPYTMQKLGKAIREVLAGSFPVPNAQP